MKKYIICLPIIFVLFFVSGIYATDENMASYDVLGESYSAYDILQAGFEPVTSHLWKISLAEHVDRYIFIKNDCVVVEGLVFHDIDPSLTHDDICDFIEENVDNGYIQKVAKCFSGDAGGYCKNIEVILGDIFTFPTTVYTTKYTDTNCYVTKTSMFSENERELQFFYVCTLDQ